MTPNRNQPQSTGPMALRSHHSIAGLLRRTWGCPAELVRAKRHTQEESVSHNGAQWNTQFWVSLFVNYRRRKAGLKASSLRSERIVCVHASIHVKNGFCWCLFEQKCERLLRATQTIHSERRLLGYRPGSHRVIHTAHRPSRQALT